MAAKKCSGSIIQGQVFGKLTVVVPDIIRRHEHRTDHFVSCQCECGNEAVIRRDHLLNGRSQSCGCLNAAMSRARKLRHGLTVSGMHPIYQSWRGMKTRCYNQRCRAYPFYGGRGIVVDECWLHSSDAFIEWSMRNGWQDGLEIDRIDNNGPYSPSNCRWVTTRVNVNNRRTTRIISAFGETKTLSDWLLDNRVLAKRSTILSRIDYGKWSPEMALSRRSRNAPTASIENYTIIDGEVL